MASMLTRLVLALAALAFAGAALAQRPYPARPVRLIVAFAPGTTSDLLGRMVAEKLSQALEQPFSVDNRTGAGGTIAAGIVAKATPDGYTLLVSTAALPVSAHIFPKLAYDTAVDFASITVAAQTPQLLAAHADFPAQSVGALIDYARQHPGKVSFGSTGPGTSPHLAGEKLKLDTLANLVHVPFNGAESAHAGLLAGQVQIMFDNVVALLPHVKAGKLRALAVSSAQRHPLLADVPTLHEAGVKDFESSAWFGFAAPAATPRAIVQKLNAEIVKAIRLPDVAQKITEGGSVIVGSSPEDADRHLRAEIGKWARVVREAKLRP
jgi:tripartite-type tricarboxylate transporter receptor subunit TctC